MIMETQQSISRSVALKAAVDFWNGTPGKLDYDTKDVIKVAEIFLEWLTGKTIETKELKDEKTSFDEEVGEAYENQTKEG